MRRHVLPPAVALTLLAATTPASAATIERVDVLPAGVEPAYAAKARTQSADATGSRVVFSAGRTVYLRDRAAGQSLDLVQGLGGAAPNDISDTAVISDDGRVVAFASRAWNLVEGDGPESYFGNQTYDIYVRVLGTDGYERMSIASDGSAPPGRWGAVNPSISADGAYVAFETEQALHPDDGDGASDIYVRDRRNGVTELASTLGQATSANEPAISADGRVVAFATSEPLLADDTNEALDVYVRDMRTRALERVSVGENDQQADADAAYDTAISADGRFVVFSTIAEGLVAGDDRGWDDRDVFVRDRVAGTTEIASIGGAGRQVDGDAGSVDISGDGRFVSFSYESYGPLADRLVPTDDDRVGHVRDRQLRRTRTLRDVETNDCCFAQWFELTSDGRHALWKGYAHDFGDDVGGNDHYSHVYLADVEPGADGEPPALEVPEDRVVAARDATGVTVRYAARATDANDPAPELGCSPGSGARFPLGTTTVRCLAVDEAGNEATAAFSVDVRDARAPLLMLPERIALDDDGSGGAVLVDTFAAVDDVDGTRPAACELPPDRRFAVGEHVVLCSASDAAGNRAEGSFTLVVRPSSPAPTLSVADIRLSERVRWQAVQVTRTGPATSELLLPVTVWPGTARRPLDFDSDAQSVFFAAGQRQATIWIAPRDDHKDEAEETLTVHVDGLSLGLRTASGTLTLLDDDPPRAPSRRRVEVGPLFYVGAGGRALVKVDPAASEPAPEIVRTFDGTIGRPSVSPDGTSVLVVERRAGSSRLLRVPVDGGAPAEIELQWDADGVLGGGDAGATRVREPAWNPDGRSFAVLADADCDCSAGLIGWFPAAGGPLIDAYSTRGATERLTWAPDGARLAFAEDSPDATGQELTILDVETGERVSLTDTPDVDESDPAWSPDGRALAFTRIDRDTGARTLARMAPEAGSGITVLAGAPGRRLMEPAWAPDSSRIAFVERDDARPPGEADRLRSVRPDGEDLRSHADESQSPRRPDWAPGPARSPPRRAGSCSRSASPAGRSAWSPWTATAGTAGSSPTRARTFARASPATAP